MDAILVRLWLETKAEISFSRSSGPGGQNVNKVNTKTLIRVPLDQVEGLTLDEITLLKISLKSRLTLENELVIQVQDERSQLANRELAVDRVLEVIIRGLHRDKPRRATKPTKASKERRLTAKKTAATRKAGRSIPRED